MKNAIATSNILFLVGILFFIGRIIFNLPEALICGTICICSSGLIYSLVCISSKGESEDTKEI